MLTELETAVLDAMLERPGAPFVTLREQLSRAEVSKREFTRVGFFTHFALPEAAPVARNVPDATLGADVAAEIPGLKHGAGFVLFIRGGAITMLEGFTYDEKWPENTAGFRISRAASA